MEAPGRAVGGGEGNASSTPPERGVCGLSAGPGGPGTRTVRSSILLLSASVLTPFEPGSFSAVKNAESVDARDSEPISSKILPLRRPVMVTLVLVRKDEGVAELERAGAGGEVEAEEAVPEREGVCDFMDAVPSTTDELDDGATGSVKTGTAAPDRLILCRFDGGKSAAACAIYERPIVGAGVT